MDEEANPDPRVEVADATARGMAIGLACRGMAVATAVSAFGNLLQVLAGDADLVPALVGSVLACAANLALLRPIERDHRWATPALLAASVLVVLLLVLVETEAGVFLYASFGSLYVTMLGSLRSRHPERWPVAGGLMFVTVFGTRQLVDPLESLRDPAELTGAIIAGGVATWAVSVWVIQLLERLREVNEDLVNARDDALEANRIKDRFLANMSHELRTPLTTIRGYADILLDDGHLDPIAAEDLVAIRSAAQHLTELLTAVLDLSRIDADERPVVITSVDLAEVLQEAVRVAQPLAREHDNRIETDLAPDLGHADTDRTMIRQIVLNLIGNACKFTEQGTVALRARRDGAHLELVVADDGIGIPADRLEAVFDRFVQAEHLATRARDGVGLGLALVRRLCELLDGEVSVESTVGEGSTFRVRLPLHRPLSAAPEPAAAKATGTSPPRAG